MPIWEAVHNGLKKISPLASLKSNHSNRQAKKNPPPPTPLTLSCVTRLWSQSVGVCAALLLSSGDAPFSCVSSSHSFVAPDVKSAVVFLPHLRDMLKSLSVSVLEMRPCHISHRP